MSTWAARARVCVSAATAIVCERQIRTAMYKSKKVTCFARAKIEKWFIFSSSKLSMPDAEWKGFNLFGLFCVSRRLDVLELEYQFYFDFEDRLGMPSHIHMTLPTSFASMHVKYSPNQISLNDPLLFEHIYEF